MDTDAFWQLIDDSLNHAPDRDARQAFLRDCLSALPTGDVVEFQVHLDRACDRAYTWDLAGAATRIFGGWLSDDGFEYFRCWLVGRGRSAFERAIAHPDSLAGLPEIRCLAGRHCRSWNSDTEWPEWELLAYVAIDAYAQVAGDDDECGEAFYAVLKARLAMDAFARTPRGKYWDAHDDVTAMAVVPDLAAMFLMDTLD